MLSQQQQEQLQVDGFLLLKGFYDHKKEIQPIQAAIHALILELLDYHQLAVSQREFSPERFDADFMTLVHHDRSLGSQLYDAVKQIPAFLRLLSSEKQEQLASSIFDSDLVGIAHGGYGLRIDIPGEDHFRAPWHQDFTAQLRSSSGLVFWSPLVEITPDLGPVEFCVGSQQEGAIPIELLADGRQGAYSFELQDRDTRISRYAQTAPLAQPGDLVLIDYHTIHRSGFNRSNRARWSMQMRLFDFRNPLGRSLAWKGGPPAEANLRKYFPELIING